MQLRITKPNEPERFLAYTEGAQLGNNQTLEALQLRIEHNDEIMQVDVIDDGGNYVKTLVQHPKMKALASANKVAEIQRDKISTLEEENANLKKLLEVQGKQELLNKYEPQAKKIKTDKITA